MNQTPEQIARDEIDQQLQACGWKVQSKKQINLPAGLGVAVREYQTDIGPADYVLFVDKKPVGVIEAKRKDEGFRLVSEQQQIVQEIESRLSVCDKMEETITTSLQQAEALRQSILKKAFEGKLVGAIVGAIHESPIV